MYEDSQCILAELEDPFKEVKDEPQVKTELNINENENNKSKKRIKKDDANGKAYNPATLKLDLKNSKWWQPGFNNEYFQEQLNKFIRSKSNEENLVAAAQSLMQDGNFPERANGLE